MPPSEEHQRIIGGSSEDDRTKITLPKLSNHQKITQILIKTIFAKKEIQKINPLSLLGFKNNP